MCAIERSRRGANGHHLSCHSGRRRYISLDRSAVLPGQPCQAPVRGENLFIAAAVGSLSAAAPLLTGPSLKLPANQCPRGTGGCRYGRMPNVPVPLRPPTKHGREDGGGSRPRGARRLPEEGRGRLWSRGFPPGPLTAVGRCPLARTRSAGVGAGALLSHQLLPPRTAPEAL